MIPVSILDKTVHSPLLGLDVGGQGTAWAGGGVKETLGVQTVNTSLQESYTNKCPHQVERGIVEQRCQNAVEHTCETTKSRDRLVSRAPTGKVE